MKDSQQLLLYTLRPDGTALWLPAELVESIGLDRGDRLTEAEYNLAPVQALIAERSHGKQR